MHTIVTAIGSSGDINPMLLIAEELVRRGHDVDFMASPRFQKDCDAHGLKLIPLGTVEEYERVQQDPNLWVPEKAFACVWKHVKPTIRPHYDLMSQHLRPDTVLVGTTLAFSARMLQEKRGIPFSSVHLQPSMMMSAYDIPPIPGFGMPEWIPLAFKKFMMSSIDTFFLDAVCKNGLNEVRAGIGLPPVEHVITRWMHSPQQVLLAFPEWFGQRQPDWVPHAMTFNFPVYAQNGAQIPSDVEKFLQDGPPPVLVTAGSAMRNPREFFEKSLAVLRELKTRALLVSAFPDQVPPLDNSAIHARHLPYDLVFPRMAAVVHHGGIGTTAQCLKAGVPQIVTSLAHDQFDNAAKVEKLGVGFGASHSRINDWKSKLSRALSDAQIKQNCQLYKNRMVAEGDPVPKMVDAIEKLAWATHGVAPTQG